MKGESRWRETFRRLRRNRGAMAGLVVLILLILMALAAPLLAPYPPSEITAGEGLKPPSSNHLLGTDKFGRDVLSRIIWGSRISLRVGLTAIAIAAFIGVVIGLVAGFYGGWIDSVLMRCVDVLLAFPGILLALAIVATLGPDLRNLMIAVGISLVPAFARLVRGSVLTVKELPYVDAARTIGCSDHRIIILHVLPNVLAPIIVLATLGIAFAILIAAALSFLGLGAQPPTPEWGAVIADGRRYLRTAWWISTFPGIAIMITVLSINLFGDGLRDALDPRLRIQ